MHKNRYFDFMLADLISVGCNFLSRFLFQEAFSFELAIILSYCFGAITAFSLLTPVFAKHKSSIFKYVTLNIAGVIQTFIVSIWIYAVLESDVPSDVACTTAHSVALGCLLLTNYFAHNKMRAAKRKA